MSGWKMSFIEIASHISKEYLDSNLFGPALETIFLVVRGGALSPRQPYHCPHLISVIARARILHHKFYQSHTRVEIMEH